MMQCTHMRSWIVLSALALGACAAETSSPAVADHLEVVQAPTTGTPGRALDSLILVRVVDDHGAPMPGVTVTWSVIDGGGTVVPIQPTTGTDGIAAARWQLGIDASAQSLNVASQGVASLTVAIEAKAFRAIAIAQGDGFGCGVDSLGDAWCWGSMYNYPAARNFGAVPVRVDSGHALLEVVAGGRHACARSATTTYCWGNGYAVGQGPAVPTNVYVNSAPVVGGHQFTALSSDGSGNSTCGLDAAGQGWCWGIDVDGSLGSPAGWRTTATTPLPIDQDGATFTELDLGYDHGCALEATGVARCWGRNRAGKLGDTLNTNGVALKALPVTTALRFAHIRVGDDTSCGTTATGETWCWGADSFSGTYTEGPRPWQVPGGSYSPPAIQWTHWAAIRSGLVYFWGRLDVNDADLPGFLQARPGETPGKVTAVVELALSFQTLCARRVDGVVLCWGNVPDPSSPYGSRIAETPNAVPAP